MSLRDPKFGDWALISNTLFLDPGESKGHGSAVFSPGSEVICVSLYVDNVLPTESGVGCVVIEMPAEAFSGTVNTIIRLARAAERAVAGYLVAGVPVVYVPPSGAGAWKAGAKAQHQYNAWYALTATEQQLIVDWCRNRGLKKLLTRDAIETTLQTRCAKACGGSKPGEWLLGNVLDAVYLGLWAHGRIDQFGRR